MCKLFNDKKRYLSTAKPLWAKKVVVTSIIPENNKSIPDDLEIEISVTYSNQEIHPLEPIVIHNHTHGLTILKISINEERDLDIEVESVSFLIKTNSLDFSFNLCFQFN